MDNKLINPINEHFEVYYYLETTHDHFDRFFFGIMHELFLIINLYLNLE